MKNNVNISDFIKSWDKSISERQLEKFDYQIPDTNVVLKGCTIDSISVPNENKLSFVFNYDNLMF